MSEKSLDIPSSKRAPVVVINPATDNPIAPELLKPSECGSMAAITGGKYRSFFDKSKEGTIARNAYLKTFFSGTFLIIILIFSVFSIFWGALWKIPARALSGIVVDFDGDYIGSNLTELVRSQYVTGSQKIDWKFIPTSQYPGGTLEVENSVLEERAWVAIVVNEGASARLSASLTSPNASYDGTTAITVFGVEGRNENAFRNIIQPAVKGLLDGFSMQMALQTAKSATDLTPNLIAVLLSVSSKTLIAPVSYQIVNLAPFAPVVASAATFVGLILQLILAFFVVMVSAGAREKSYLEQTLSTRDLIILRLLSSFGAYFVISLCFSLLSVAFQVSLTKIFGHAGFLVFWALNYVGMLSVGLALESLVTLLTTKLISFFMVVWIIVNISVCLYPIDVLPGIFKYGYAAPFYNISRAMRTIIFGTKNRLGLNFSILIIWIVISCITLPLLQIFVRQKIGRADFTVATPRPKWEGEDDTDRKDDPAESSAA